MVLAYWVAQGCCAQGERNNQTQWVSLMDLTHFLTTAGFDCLLMAVVKLSYLVMAVAVVGSRGGIDKMKTCCIL